MLSSLVRVTFDPCFSENKGFQSNKTGARPSARSERVDLDLDRIWLYLMELPTAKTVPPLLLLKALEGALDLECLPLLLLLKRDAARSSRRLRRRSKQSLLLVYKGTQTACIYI